MATEARFAIGTKFRTRGKNPRICMVTDVHRTFNAAGDLVSIRYQATHDFMGQAVTSHDVVDATIAMGLIVD